MKKKAKDYNTSLLTDVYGALLTKHQLDLIRDYYDLDMSLSELSEKYGIARQSAKGAIDAAEKSLNDIEDKLQLVKRLKQIDNYTDKLLELKPSQYDYDKYVDLIKKIKSSIYFTAE